MSYHWTGFWEQSTFGIQSMFDLEMSFENGEIHGAGRDVIGAFQIGGEILGDGSVHLLKQYEDAHCVHYDGQYDGEGSISGQWRIDGYWERGTFGFRLVRGSETSNEM